MNEQESYKQKYREYLKSPQWATKKLAALKRAKYRCQLCNSKNKPEVHHRTYENVFNEKDEDLTVLCKDCHYNFSKPVWGKKRESKPIQPILSREEKLKYRMEFKNEIRLVDAELKRLHKLRDRSPMREHKRTEEQIDRLNRIKEQLVDTILS